MRISVIVPSYNEETYLPRCLKALKDQTLPPLEIIVIDNNSSDNTFNIATSHGVKTVKEPIQGLTPARQRGFKEAKGEIVARVDADCIPDRHWIEEIAKHLQRTIKQMPLPGRFFILIFRDLDNYFFVRKSIGW